MENEQPPKTTEAATESAPKHEAAKALLDPQGEDLPPSAMRNLRTGSGTVAGRCRVR